MARRIAKAIVLVLLPLACIGSTALVFVLDQTSALAYAYLSSVNTGNTWTAALLGDHYSDEKDWRQRFYEQDIQRDVQWLQGAEISDVTATREQTLSGQWVTMLRFNWRPAGTMAPPESAVLRVKTEKWFLLSYIRAVELVDY
jgi:ABC-type glycerol-3-phosphate transport system substrate-binding protein